MPPTAEVIRRVTFNKSGEHVISLDALGSIAVREASTGKLLSDVPLKAVVATSTQTVQGIETISAPQPLGRYLERQSAPLLGR